jgi:hypothetical protein
MIASANSASGIGAAGYPRRVGCQGCEHAFVTSQGSPSARFHRALGTGNALLAWAAAAELPHVNLEDALALVLVLRGNARYSRAAARWIARLTLESRGVNLGHVAAALDALEDGTDLAPLAAVCRDLGQHRCVRVVSKGGIS